MGLFHYLWSRTAASNGTADSGAPWPEGMAPSAVNDAARGMMASAAAFRDDISGAIATGGTSTAYTVTSYQIFDTLAHMGGQMIAFTPHATNTNAAGVDLTLNVDGLGAKSVRMQPSVALPGGTLVLGTPYVVLYNNSDAVFYLQNMTNPYSIPLGGSLDFWGATAPNSSFALMYGQAISRTTYATLFTMFSTTYGSGDGSTTFNIPDLRGRTVYGKHDMGGSDASPARMTTAAFGTSPATLGSVGGAESVTLATNQIPSLTSVNASQSITVTAAKNLPGTTGSWTNYAPGGSGSAVPKTDVVDVTNINSMTGSNSISVTYTNASQQITKTLAPGIVGNKVLRLI